MMKVVPLKVVVCTTRLLGSVVPFCWSARLAVSLIHVTPAREVVIGPLMLLTDWAGKLPVSTRLSRAAPVCPLLATKDSTSNVTPWEGSVYVVYSAFADG